MSEAINRYKFVSIIGIHAQELFFDGTGEEAAAKWSKIIKNPDFTAGAYFKGGLVAPLSGQRFSVVATASKQVRR